MRAEGSARGQMAAETHAEGQHTDFKGRDHFGGLTRTSRRLVGAALPRRLDRPGEGRAVVERAEFGSGLAVSGRARQPAGA